jgi:hypothetical protein
MADPGLVNTAACRRGVDYLMRKQEADGSCHVRTRAFGESSSWRRLTSIKTRSIPSGLGLKLENRVSGEFGEMRWAPIPCEAALRKVREASAQDSMIYRIC